jgi:hypothetical protein
MRNGYKSIDIDPVDLPMDGFHIDLNLKFYPSRPLNGSFVA